MEILNEIEIQRKINRLAYQIAEQNFDESEILLVGININGLKLAHLMLEKLQMILSSCKISVHQLLVDLSSEHQRVKFTDDSQLNNKAVVIIDDVANSGKTLFYGFRPFQDAAVRKLQICVLIDRQHKLYPIKVDFVGLSLSTTLQEHILVHFPPNSVLSATLN